MYQLRHMNVVDILPLVFSHNTNDKPAIKDETVLSGVKNIMSFLMNNA